MARLSTDSPNLGQPPEQPGPHLSLPRPAPPGEPRALRSPPGVSSCCFGSSPVLPARPLEQVARLEASASRVYTRLLNVCSAWSPVSQSGVRLAQSRATQSQHLCRRPLPLGSHEGRFAGFIRSAGCFASWATWYLDRPRPPGRVRGRRKTTIPSMPSERKARRRHVTAHHGFPLPGLAVRWFGVIC